MQRETQTQLTRTLAELDVFATSTSLRTLVGLPLKDAPQGDTVLAQLDLEGRPIDRARSVVATCQRYGKGPENLLVVVFRELLKAEPLTDSQQAAVEQAIVAEPRPAMMQPWPDDDGEDPSSRTPESEASAWRRSWSASCGPALRCTRPRRRRWASCDQR